MAGNRRKQIKRIFKELDEKVQPHILIETGTHKGHSTAIFSEYFTTVETIEINQNYYEKAMVFCEGIDNISFHFGDSANILKELCVAHKDPVIFFLDAHNVRVIPLVEEGFPLWDEIDTIIGRNQSDIIVIDDVHTFGKQRPELTFNDELNWEEVTVGSILKKIGKERVLKSYLVKDVFVIHLT